MTPKNKNPAPRANAGSRANSDIERNRNNSFALDWEADTAVVWLARRITYAGGARARPCGPGEPWEGLSTNGPADAAQEVADARASLLRDFVFEALAPVECDAAAARLCLRNEDDAGARYHLKRVAECVEAAVSTFRELEALIGRTGG